MKEASQKEAPHGSPHEANLHVRAHVHDRGVRGRDHDLRLHRHRRDDVHGTTTRMAGVRASAWS